MNFPAVSTQVCFSLEELKFQFHLIIFVFLNDTVYFYCLILDPSCVVYVGTCNDYIPSQFSRKSSEVGLACLV